MALLTQDSPCMPIMPSCEGMRGGDGAEAEEGAGDGDLVGFGEGDDFGFGAGFDDAVAGEDDGLLRGWMSSTASRMAEVSARSMGWGR